MRMRRRTTVLAASGGAIALALGSLAVAMAPEAGATAQAAMAASGTYNAQDGTRFLNNVGNQIVSPTDGTYVLQTNLWNKAVAGHYQLNWDNQSTAWSLSGNTANSYFPNGDESSVTGAKACSTDPNSPNFDGPNATTHYSGDTGCNWVGHGDPWLVNGTGDQFATTNGVSPFVPQQPPAGTGTHAVGLTTEFSNQIHAPASYADIFTGCHWNVCSNGSTPTIPKGAPFPLQYSGVSRLDSVWDLTVPAVGQYDAAYDIWLDSNTRNCPTSGNPCTGAGNTLPFLPGNPGALGGSATNPGQNDGAEIMIWEGHHGYTVTPAGQAPLNNTIQPAGKQLNLDASGNVVPIKIVGADGRTLGATLGGAESTFDVWAGRSRSFDNGIRWNVITFVNRVPITNGGLVSRPALPNGGFDAKAFIDYAASTAVGSQCSTDPNSPLTPETTLCVDPHWWLTSVQAGYEIWNLPDSTQPGNGADVMATNRFSVTPIAVSGGVNTGGRSCPVGGCAPNAPQGTPLVYWLDKFDIQAQGCTGDTNATWQISATNFANGGNVPNTKYPATLPATGQAGLGRLVENPAGSGNYISSPQAGPLNDQANMVLHDLAIITITINCSGVPRVTTASVFIDPAGEVVDAADHPLPGIRVTLLRSATENGTFVPVANHDDTVMCGPNSVPTCTPQNDNNPTLTDSAGGFRWDVTTAWYKVSATNAAGTCTVTSPAEHVLPPPNPTVPPVKLVLDCSGGGLTTRVVVRGGGVPAHGYCADVFVTNNTGAPVTWNTSFAIPGGQHISQTWNMALTQNGAQAVNVHADAGSASWNAILQPGQTTHDNGFCTTFS